ncbi:MAG: hypothetical protein MJZ23_00800 [Paludibacteraceae bacterium]|nr:hypothetical protein [Paludibacteraceae bacterium]
MRIKRMILFYLGVTLILGLLSLCWPENGIKTSWHTFRFPQVTELLNLPKASLVDEASAAVKDVPQQTPVERINDLGEEMQLKSEYTDEYDKQFLNFNETSPARIYLPNNNIHYFDKLFARMDSCLAKNELIHIAHYGDSQIEGDRITAYLRKRLQDRFGGSGPGLLPIEKNDGGSYSVRWKNSQNFEKFIADGTLQKEAMHKRYGALAQYVKFAGNAQFRLLSRMESHPSFDRVRLFVGKTSKGFEATLTNESGKALKQTIEDANEGASVITWSPGTMKNCNLRMKGNCEIYGISLENSKGISADNIPMRGSSGTFFTRMDASLFTYMHNQLNTQLILLEFGGNAMPRIKNEQDIKDYRTLFDMQLKWLKKACPAATYIVLGPSDMGIKVNGEVTSRPFLEEQIASMKECSLENGVAFWDMYDVMGGHNSMISWVKQTPQLAASDYTHLTRTGAKEMAKLFSNALFNYYDFYEKHKK